MKLLRIREKDSREGKGRRYIKKIKKKKVFVGIKRKEIEGYNERKSGRNDD